MEFGFASLDFFNVLEFGLHLARDASVFLAEINFGGAVHVDLVIAFI